MMLTAPLRSRFATRKLISCASANRHYRAGLIACALASSLTAAMPAGADEFRWNGGSTDWDDSGNWDNNTLFGLFTGPPRSFDDAVVLGSLNPAILGSNVTVTDLSIVSGGIVRNAQSAGSSSANTHVLNVTGPVGLVIRDDNGRLEVFESGSLFDVITSNLTVTNEGELQLFEGAEVEVQGDAFIGNSSRITGDGRLFISDTPSGASGLLTNDGIIFATTGTLVVTNSLSNATFDADGDDEDGQLYVNNNSELRIEIPYATSSSSFNFNGDLLIGTNADFFSFGALTLASGSTMEVSGGSRYSGAALTNSSTIFALGGVAVFESDFVQTSTGVIDLALGAGVRFEGNADFDDADDIQYNGINNEIIIAGSTFNSDNAWTLPATNGGGLFFDPGEGNTSVLTGGTLTINNSIVVESGEAEFDTIVNQSTDQSTVIPIGSSAVFNRDSTLGRLSVTIGTLDVDDDATLTVNGTANISSSTVFLGTGETLDFAGGADLRAVTLDAFGGDLIFRGTSNINNATSRDIGSGGTLQSFGTTDVVDVSAIQLTGGDSLLAIRAGTTNLTEGGGVLNWDGTIGTANTTVAEGATLNINVASIDTTNDDKHDGTIDLAGTLNVEVDSGQWEVGNLLRLLGGTLGGDRVRVSGLMDSSAAFQSTINTDVVVENGGKISVDGFGSTLSQLGSHTLTLGSASGSVDEIDVVNNAVFNTGTGTTTINKTGTLNINTGGTFNADGDLNLIGGTLAVELDEPVDGTFGPITVAQEAAISGDAALDLTVGSGFNAAFGASYTIIDAESVVGQFATVNGVTGHAGLANNEGLAVIYGPDAVIVRPTLLGDANLDGVVGSDDFNLLAFNFGDSDMTWADGDFNGDGIVGSDDFNLLAFNFGESVNLSTAELARFEAFGESIAVPEPSSLALLALGGMMLSRRRRRAA
jgi:hypothetical protein